MQNKVEACRLRHKDVKGEPSELHSHALTGSAWEMISRCRDLTVCDIHCDVVRRKCSIRAAGTKGELVRVADPANDKGLIRANQTNGGKISCKSKQYVKDVFDREEGGCRKNASFFVHGVQKMASQMREMHGALCFIVVR